MDYMTMAGTALAALSPYLVKGGEEIAKGVGKDLWELIKKPFVKDRDKKLIDALELKPDDEATMGAVRFKLSEFLEDDHGFLGELENLLQAIPSSGDHDVVTQTVQGSDNIVIGKASGTVTITR